MIRMNCFAAEPAELRRLEAAAVERVLRSGSFILGSEGEQFEEAWAEFCGRKFCAGTGNGLEALELGLRALDIGRGDEVVTTPVTAIATILAILRTGATPVLADIDPATALLDPASVERCITSQTKAVLLVHLYGQVAQMNFWDELCKRSDIHLLEDCAQAHGAKFNHAAAGASGTWGAFSFYPTKNLGAKGDAGAFVTDSPEISARVKMLRNCGTVKRYEHPERGMNSRLDEIQAAILLARLRWLDRFNARRREIAREYFAQISNPKIELPARPQSAGRHVYHLFVVRCAERDRLMQFFLEMGVETLIHYPVPAHRQPACRDVRRDPLGLPNAEKHCDNCLSLPCHPQMTEDEVARVILAANSFA